MATYVKPGTKAYAQMTPDQRNANTLLQLKQDIAGPKKTSISWSTVKAAAAAVKKAADAKKAAANKPKATTTTPAPKAAAPKAEAKPAAKKQTETKKESFNLDAEVKKAMRGDYGSGSARKAALGDNYSKVQAEINKRTAANKPKTSATKPVEKREVPTMEPKKIDMTKTSSPNQSASGSETKITPKGTKSGGSGMGAMERSDREAAEQGFKRGGSVKRKTYKTGGMVNSNSKISTSRTTKGKVGGISKSPKTAIPKAKYGMTFKRKK